MNAHNTNLPHAAQSSEDMAQTGQIGNHPVPAAQLTVATSTFPEVLTKRFSLEGGELQKHVGGVLVSGRAEKRRVQSLKDFAELLQSLGANQALIYGVPEADAIDLTTRDRWEAEGRPEGIIPRTNETFSWPDGPGIMMLDYDPEPGLPSLSREDLVAAIRQAVPGLRNVEMLWWPSASSYIRNAETNAVLTGLRGQRLYMMVQDASDIPRAGEALAEYLWRDGYGTVKVSASGSLLPRTLVDTMVWQPSRLDFAAGAQCDGPLVQDRGAPVLIPGDVTIVSTQDALPDLSPSALAVVERLREDEKTKKADAAAAARAAWVETHAVQTAGPDADDSTLAAARKAVLRALDTDVLSGDFVLHVLEGRRVVRRTVRQVLDDPKRYHRAHTLDPIEPEYDGGRDVGMLFLKGATKTLHSFARGGKTYRLARVLVDVPIPSGRVASAVEETLEILRGQENIFDHGDDLALQKSGRIHSLNEHALNQELGCSIQYYGFNSKGSRVDRDPPPAIAKRILAMKSRRELKPLKAVITAPTLRLDGTLLNTPGYDPATELFYYAGETPVLPDIAETPSRKQVKRALKTLWHPFKEFPFNGSVDRGVMLAALLTAAVRPVLPTAPAFGFDAPIQGSGKSLLASCLAALAGEQKPSVYPHTNDEAEIRKRLLSVLRSGVSAMVWDNVLGVFNSASMAALLTSSTFSDRVLGQSESVTLPNRLLMAITGNNLTLDGDMVRRVLVARIDPRTDLPHERGFDHDPLQYVVAHRMELVAAALTVLRGWLTSGAKPPSGRIASFEDWNDWVRCAVYWVGQEVAPERFSDPLDAITRALENDPDLDALSELLSALEANFGPAEFTSQEVMSKIARYKDPSMARLRNDEDDAFRLYEALITLNPKAVLTTASLGRTLGFRKDRMVNGRVLRSYKDSHSKKSLWRVNEVA